MGNMSRGFAALTEAKKKRDTRMSNNRSGTFRLKVEDGQTVRFRFVGNFRPVISDEDIDAMSVEEAKDMLAFYGGARRNVYDPDRKKDEKPKKESSKEALKRRMRETEPFVNIAHTVKVGPGDKDWRSFTCTEDSLEETFRYTVEEVNGKQKKVPAKCVGHFCNGQKGKYKHVGYPNESTCFSVWVEDKQHREELKEGNAYHSCTAEDGKCRWCMKASEKGPIYPARAVGLRALEASRTVASQAQTIAEKVKKRCMCGEGKLKVEDYACGMCGEVLADLDGVMPGVTVRCPSCKKRSEPVTMYSCSACEDPRPGTLLDYPMEMSRAGVKKSTTYMLSIRDGEKACALPSEAMERGAVDWLREKKPIGTAEQASMCGLSKDPFGGSTTGSSSYDDDEDDDG